MNCCTNIIYTVSQKTSHLVLSIFSPNINRLSKLFHWHTPWKICNEVICEYSTTSLRRRYTTVWNTNVRITNDNRQHACWYRGEWSVRRYTVDIWRVERSVCFWPSWLIRLTSSSTHSGHFLFSTRVLWSSALVPVVGASRFPIFFQASV